MIRNWEDRRCISGRTKVFAVGLMLIAGGASMVFALEDNTWRIITALLLATGCTTILSIKTCGGSSTEQPPRDAI
jgi:uncharacterized membrane protein YbaN (DUF454 family)